MLRTDPFYQCPRYSKCSVNACPLDPIYPRFTDECDSEKKCKLSKDERVKISSMFPSILKLNGLTELEAQTSK